MTLESSLEGRGRIHRQSKEEEHLNQIEQPLQRHRSVKENGLYEGSPCDPRMSGWARCVKGESPGDEVGKVGRRKTVKGPGLVSYCSCNILLQT